MNFPKSLSAYVEEIRSPFCLISSLVCSLWLVCGNVVLDSGSLIRYIHDGVRAGWVFVQVILIFAVLDLCIAFIYILLDIMRNTFVSKSIEKSSSIELFNHIIILFLCWFPHLLIHAPASVNWDYLNQLNQFFGGWPLSNHHPIFLTYAYGWIFKIGYTFGKAPGGFLLSVVFQNLLMVIVFSLLLCWMKRHCSRSSYFTALALCVFSPIVPEFTAILTKDTPSAALVVLFMLQLVVRYQSISEGRSVPTYASLPALTLCAIASMLTRHNCLYVMIFVLFVCFSLEKHKFHLAVSIAVILTTSVVWTFAIVPKVGASKSDSALMLSATFQQIGAYCQISGDDIDADDRAVLNGCFDIPSDSLGELYDPWNVDPIKNHVTFKRTSVGRYLFIWAKLGLRHPEIYFDALLRSSVGYWCPLVPYEHLQDLDYFTNDPASHYQPMKNAGFAFPGILASVAEAKGWFVDLRHLAEHILTILCSHRLTSLLFQPAFYTWIDLILATYCLSRRLPSGLPLFVAVLLFFFINCISPLAASVRYALPLIALLPLILSACLVSNHPPA